MSLTIAITSLATPAPHPAPPAAAVCNMWKIRLKTSLALVPKSLGTCIVGFWVVGTMKAFVSKYSAR